MPYEQARSLDLCLHLVCLEHGEVVGHHQEHPHFVVGVGQLQGQTLVLMGPNHIAPVCRLRHLLTVCCHSQHPGVQSVAETIDQETTCVIALPQVLAFQSQVGVGVCFEEGKVVDVVDLCLEEVPEGSAALLV